MIKDKKYGVGVILTVFGAAGIAEVITSDKGSFMFCAVILSIGLALIIDSYVRKN